MKSFSYLIQAGGYLVVVLGLVILLMFDDTGIMPHTLVNFTLGSVFFFGGLVLYYLFKYRKL